MSLDAATLQHLNAWLARSERPEDWDAARSAIIKFLDEYPDFIDKGWREVLNYAERNGYYIQSNPAPKINKNKKPAQIDLKEARKIYENFTGHDGETIARIEKPTIPDAVAVIGEIDGIMYSTVRAGVEEKYVHKFNKNSRPLLCVAPDGKSVYVLGGAFDFTDRGFIDRG